MRFCVERNLLTDDTGKVVPANDPTRFSYTYVDATDVSEAITDVAAREGGKLIHDVYRMAPIQAMATLRRNDVVMTLHAFPESEAAERLHGARRH